MTVSQYEYAYPVVREWFDGNGWKTAGVPEEGLVWLVRTQESIDKHNKEEAQVLREYELGVRDLSEVPSPPTYGDEYLIADRVELKEGHLIFSLGTPQHNVSVKVYAPGYWREFHLVGDAHEIAKRTATMLKDDDE